MIYNSQISLENGIMPFKTRLFGLSLYGSLKEEFEPAIHLLLNRDLPEKWEWVNSSAHAIVAKRLEPSPAYYKEFLSRSSLEWLKGLVRGSRCTKARLNRESLSKNGFHSPIIHCWGKKGPRHFMITEGVAAIGLADFIHKNWQPPLSKNKIAAKREIIESLGQEIGLLHKAGIYHGDLRLNNILIKLENNKTVFYFIDNERNRGYGRIPLRLIEKNLVQVNMVFPICITLQDRLRFFKAYSMEYARFSPSEEKMLMQKVQNRTLQRLSKKAILTSGLHETKGPL